MRYVKPVVVDLAMPALRWVDAQGQEPQVGCLSGADVGVGDVLRVATVVV